MASANWAIPHVTTGQSGGEVRHNDALNRIDTIMQLGVVDFDLNTTPGSPTNGQAWKVGASPTGAWSGNADKIAFYYSGWLYIDLKDGMRLYDNTNDIFYVCRVASTDTWDTVITSTSATVAALVDNSGGTANDTIAAITQAANAGSADFAVTQDAIADLAAKIEQIRIGLKWPTS